MEWKPLSEAPRDGTVLLFWDELFEYQIGWWGEYEFDERVREGWNDGAFPIVFEFDGDARWTELPEPPND